MSLRVTRAAADAERQDELHLARLLILMLGVDSRKRTVKTRMEAIEGITKLAKLDFYLRYPTYLERALLKLGENPVEVGVKARERGSIEAAMVRYRYGPWDRRYRRWLSLLHGRGLISLRLSGNTVLIGLTDHGRETANALRSREMLREFGARADLIAEHLGRMSATRLKDFTYATVPEITALGWGEEIAP